MMPSSLSSSPGLMLSLLVFLMARIDNAANAFVPIFSNSPLVKSVQGRINSIADYPKSIRNSRRIHRGGQHSFSFHRQFSRMSSSTNDTIGSTMKESSILRNKAPAPNPNPAPLVFVFNGQGSQWEQMGNDLIETNDIFRSTMEKLEASSGLPLVALYEDGSRWMSKEYSAIGIVTFQLGLLAILRDSGIRSPDYFLGHSIGELVCSFLAGLVSEEEVLQYAIVRTTLTKSINPRMRLDIYETEPEDGFDYILMSESESKPSRHQILYAKRHLSNAPNKDPLIVDSFSMDGKMVVVGCSADEITDIISFLGLKETCVACYNAPLGHTISGTSSEINILMDHVKENRKDVFIRAIDTDGVAYHAKYLNVFREYLKNEFNKVGSGIGHGMKSPPALPIPFEWISTSRNSLFSSDYLVDNLVCPVYFQEAIEQLPKGSTVVEIGPSSILLSQIKRIRSDLDRMYLVSRGQLAGDGIANSLSILKSNWPARIRSGVLSP